jgi:phosphoglycerate-specific signal transduction histidine kinase
MFSSLSISPIRDSRGRIIGASTIAHDTTRIKLAEQSLRNSEKLAVAGRMAATVAHEINNPLEAVTNALYLLVGRLLSVVHLYLPWSILLRPKN